MYKPSRSLCDPGARMDQGTILVEFMGCTGASQVGRPCHQASLPTQRTGNHLTANLCLQTQASEILQSCGWELESAVMLFFASQEAQGGGGASSAGCALARLIIPHCLEC